MTTTRKKSSASAASNKKNDAIKTIKVPALNQTVFLFKQELLQSSTDLKMLQLYHPGRKKGTFFILRKENKKVYEVLEFDEIYRSWLINDTITSNGKLYITLPIDAIFLLLHYLQKFCSQKFIKLNQIEEPDYPLAIQFLEDFADKEMLETVVDVKIAMDIVFYKYNHDKTLAWLSLKVKQLAARLKKENIYCGISSLSANYVKSEKVESVTEESEYLKVACGIVGDYVDSKLYQSLMEYLGIREDDTTKNLNGNNKRKSIKLSTSITSPDNDDNSTKRFKSEDNMSSPNVNGNLSAYLDSKVKEKKVSAKEKSLAKAATGTKSISSFFKK